MDGKKIVLLRRGRRYPLRRVIFNTTGNVVLSTWDAVPRPGNVFISILRLNNVLSKRALAPPLTPHPFPVGWEISAEGKLRKWSAVIPTGKAELFISRWLRGVQDLDK